VALILAGGLNVLFKSGNSTTFTASNAGRVILSIDTSKHKKSPRSDELSRFENGVYFGALKEMALIYARG
jgi:hypothetical protein